MCSCGAEPFFGVWNDSQGNPHDVAAANDVLSAEDVSVADGAATSSGIGAQSGM